MKNLNQFHLKMVLLIIGCFTHFLLYAQTPWLTTGNTINIISTGDFLGPINNEPLILKRFNSTVLSITDAGFLTTGANANYYHFGPGPTPIGGTFWASGNGKNSFAIGGCENYDSDESFAIGYESTNQSSSHNSFTLGNHNKNLESQRTFLFGNGINSMAAINSFGLGNDIRIGNGSNRFVIGSGFSSSRPLSNDISDNSLVVGFNSDIPTLYVGPSNGIRTTGDIGIGNSTPTAKLDVNGTFKVRDKSYLMQNVGINNLLPTKWLDVRGTNGKAINIFENILQIGTNETAAEPLLLQMGLNGNLSAANRYGTIEVMDGNDSKPLILQPNDGKVSIGLGTLPPASTLVVNGTFTATNTGNFSSDLNVNGTLTANNLNFNGTLNANNLNVASKYMTKTKIS